MRYINIGLIPNNYRATDISYSNCSVYVSANQNAVQFTQTDI